MPVQTLHTNTPVAAVFELPPRELPASCRVVIVGSGIAGASVAYHFGLAGWQDVVLLEQSKLASGTTWHSAGQVGQLRASSAQTKINKASTELYASLLAATGHDAGWLQCGGLQLAQTGERMHQLRRNAAMAEVFGVEARLISAGECADYYPMLRTGDLKGAIHLPGDGRVLPGECTLALARGAMQHEVTVMDGVQAGELIVEENVHGLKRITGVRTNRGEIRAEWVVLAGNMWMRQLGLRHGIDIPVYPCEHHYVITRPIAGVTRNSPCARDPDAGLYFRALDDGGLKLGAFKKRSTPWNIGDAVPDNFAFSLLPPDWPDFEEPFAAHCHRLKGITREDVVKFVNGPEAFTPDNHFLMGQPYATSGLFVLGGWNSAGIACSGGAGKYAVEWMQNGGMTMDLWSVDIRRFMPFHNGRKFLQDRVREVLGLHYQMAWPGRQMETARPIRAGALYEKHRNLNACFGETNGWERPLWYAPPGMQPVTEYSFVRQNWHATVAAEVKACRENVALLDQSTFAKYDLQGRDALALLQHLCANNLDVPVGASVYTAMLNERGTFESDLTVVRTGLRRFYLITSTGQQRKDADWILRHIPEGAEVMLNDITEQINVLSVMGPRSRELLGQLTTTDLSLAAFPFGTSREIIIGSHTVRATRISYVGESGWELHVPVAQAAFLWDTLMTAGQPFNLRPVGNHAISTMRIEKGFRAFGHELSTDETPLEAGLGFAVAWSKDFLGKEALLRQKAGGLRKRLVSFILGDPEIILWGGEPILWNGRPAGYTTSAAYSPTLGASVAMGYLKAADGSAITAAGLEKDNFAIIHLGQAHSAKAGLRAPFDSENRKRNL